MRAQRISRPPRQLTGHSVDGIGGTLTREAWLIVHTDLRSAPAVRAVIDEIKASFGLG
jgi:hypothetical protein